MLLKLHLLASEEITPALLTAPGRNNHTAKPQAAAVPSDIGQGQGSPPGSRFVLFDSFYIRHML